MSGCDTQPWNIDVEAYAAPPREYTSPAAVWPRGERLDSLDTYRGLTMMLLAFTVPYYDWASNISFEYSLNRVVSTILSQFGHANWEGLTLWDMIQPSFMVMVGVSLVYSYSARIRRGHGFTRLLAHSIFGAICLIVLGVFLRSLDSSATHWILEDVVTQIGLGYVPLFLLWWCGRRIQIAGIIALLVGTWLLFATWPVDPSKAGPYSGFFAHWNATGNPGQYIDQWFLNLFPRETKFVMNAGGYYTLNFVPSLATMACGLLAGSLLRAESTPTRRIASLSRAGMVLVISAVLLQSGGVCPIAKKIWTPRYVLLSGGLCLWILASLYYLVDVRRWQRFSFPAHLSG